MSDDDRGGVITGPMWMLVSAGIFGYFGYLAGINWSTPGVDGQTLFFRVLLGWTLRVSAIAFLVAAVITFVQPLLGNVVYGLTGLIGAVLLGVVIVLDWQDKQHGSVSLPILVIFAVWNGIGSWSSLMALRRHVGRRDAFPEIEDVER